MILRFGHTHNHCPFECLDLTLGTQRWREGGDRMILFLTTDLECRIHVERKSFWIELFPVVFLLESG